MMFGKFALPFLAALSVAGPEDTDKPLFIRSFEHPSPAIRQYSIAGTYGQRDHPFALSLTFRRNQWDVQIDRGKEGTMRLRLDKIYNSIPMNRIKVATDGHDKKLIVLIPFGHAQTECFSNGSEVYSYISISESGEVNLEHFPQCAFRESSLPIEKLDGVIVVGPPPQES